ncbi:MAG: trypsin-like serine protease [Phycisphaeraceae bacterium]|nr:trypsin-like serine protease [Phycisphaeraceae bacterium]
MVSRPLSTDPGRGGLPDRTVGGLRLMLIASFLSVWGMSGTVLTAGVIRHDRSDTLYRQLGAQAQYASVGALKTNLYLGSSTLLSPMWVLTAAHVIDDPATSSVVLNIGGTSQNNGTNYSAESWIIHPQWNGNVRSGYDLALVRLATPVSGIVPATRFHGADERGLIGTSVGYGRTGTGLTGDTGGAGTRRAGHNMIDAFGDQLVTTGPPGLRYSDNLFIADFDHPDEPSLNRPWSPSAVPLDLEYLPAPGDSGGGVFVDVAGGSLVAGVTSFGQTLSGSVEFKYGDAYGAVRISVFNTWIDDNITVGWVSAGSGDFHDASRWSGGQIPMGGDILGFNVAGSSTVGFEQNTWAHALLHREGQVTLELGGNSVELTSNMIESGITVGKYAGEQASLAIHNGTLAGHNVSIAALPGSSGSIAVADGGVLLVSDHLHIGGSAMGLGGTAVLTVAPGARLEVDGRLKIYDSGAVNLEGGAIQVGIIENNASQPLTLAAGSLAFDQIEGSLINPGGTVVPGRIEGTPATATISGDYQQHGQGRLKISLAGEEPGVEHDLLDVGGTVSLAGTLHLTLDEAYSPAILTTHDVVTHNGMTGRFDHLEGVLVNPQLALAVTYEVSSVRVTVALPGDANLDGLVDDDDLASVQAGLGTPTAANWSDGDFNGDGRVGLRDAFALSANYSSTAAPLSAPIPEPASTTVLLLGAWLVTGRSRRRAPEHSHV